MLLGNGDGTFQAATAVTDYASSIAVGDFNGDGKPDLAVEKSPFGDGTDFVLLGNGDGAFQGPLYYPGGVAPQSVVVADFNGDAKPDFAVGSAFEVLLSLGNGNGTFQGSAFKPRVSEGGRLSMVSGDFNGDNKLDLAVAARDTSEVSVLLGKGAGTFAAAVNYGTGPGAGSLAVSVAAGDFDGDKKLDLAVANGGSPDISVLLGKGDGTFADAVHYAAGPGASSVAVGDFNSDGRAGLAFAVTEPSKEVHSSPGCRNGGHLSLVSGDFNRDSKLDLAMAAKVTVLSGQSFNCQAI